MTLEKQLDGNILVDVVVVVVKEDTSLLLPKYERQSTLFVHPSLDN